VRATWYRNGMCLMRLEALQFRPWNNRQYSHIDAKSGKHGCSCARNPTASFSLWRACERREHLGTRAGCSGSGGHCKIISSYEGVMGQKVSTCLGVFGLPPTVSRYTTSKPKYNG
jgi:hypothetical protein